MSDKFLNEKCLCIIYYVIQKFQITHIIFFRKPIKSNSTNKEVFLESANFSLINKRF